MPRSYWQSTDTAQRADALEFSTKASNDIWSLGFGHAADQDIQGLSDHLKLADPLPVVVSDRPDAMQIRAQQQQAVSMPSASDASRASTTSSAGGFADARQTTSGGAGAAMPEVGAPVQGGGDLRQYARATAQRYGLDPDIFERQIDQESGFNPQAVSPAGAQGIAQFMPDTARGVGLADPFEPYSALDAAARHMRDNVQRNGGDYGRALAAYNAGQGAVDQYGGIPPYAETQSYVRTILGGGASAPSTAAPGANGAAGSPSSSPAAAAPPLSSPSAGAPSAQGDEMVIRNKVDGSLFRIKPSQWGPQFVPADWEIVSGGPDTMQKVGADSLPSDSGLSAGDQKRAKLAAQDASERQTTPNDATMYRQPLGPPTSGPDTFGTDQAPVPSSGGPEIADVRDVDSGPREAAPPDLSQTAPASYGTGQDEPGSPPSASPYTVVPSTAPLASDAGQTVEVQTTPRPADRYQPLAADQPLQSDQGTMVEMPVARPQADQSVVYGGGQDDPGAAPTPPRVVQASVPTPSGFPGLQAVYDSAGNFLHWIQGAAQSVGDQIGANMAGNRQAVTDANAATGVDATDFATGARRAGEVLSQWEPGGMAEARAIKRLGQINAQAAADQGINPNDPRALLTFGAADDPAWRARNPELAAEYDDLQQQVTMSVGGMVGDAANVLRGPKAADSAAVPNVGTRIRGALASNAERVAQADARAAEQGSATASATMGVAPSGSTRMYHGTAGEFARPDPGKFDSNGLFGPGYYLTSDPRVAGSYANARAAEAGGSRLSEITGRINEIDGELGSIRGVPGQEARVAALERERDLLDAEWRNTPDPSGQNVRAIDVPGGLDLLDVDAPASMDDVQSIAQNVREYHGDDAARRFLNEVTLDDNGNTVIPTGEQVWRGLRATLAEPVAAGRQIHPVTQGQAAAYANEVLQASGFDGITHQGGKRVPLLDDAGNPIEHNVTIVFPDSLDRIRNGFSGEVGGARFGFSPSASVLGDVSNSLGGGVMGAATGAALPADNEDDRRRNALLGAGAGMLLGPAAGRLMRRREGGALATFGFGPQRPSAEAAANAADPVIANVGRMMEGRYQTRQAPDPRTTAQRLADAWATAWTDNRAGLYRLQDAVSQAIGRPLQAGEMVAELSRVNPASVASQRLSENLRPALQRVGEDQDWLAQYLIHSHNVDVAREMGQRAYDAAIAKGASPNTASRLAMQAANTRQFSGDLNLAQTQKALADIEGAVKGFPDGADRWQAIKGAAQAVWDHNRQTLERKRDAGLISPDLYNELTQRYPRYVRTDIADYFEKGGGGAAPAGRLVGTSDVGIQKLDPRGTGKDRVNPLLSTIDQTYTAESAIQRNEAGKAFEELLRLDPSWGQTFREVVPRRGVNVGNPATTVPSTYKLKQGEQFLTVWDTGDARTFVVPRDFAALVQPQGGRILGDNSATNAWRAAMGIYKGLITSLRPGFSLLVSPVRDAGDYALREATRSAEHGGARGAAEAVGALPGVVADYVKAVPAAFSGILEGQYHGDLAAMMRAGAGQMSRPGHTDKDLRQALGELSRAGGIQVRSLDDLKRAAGNVLTLGAGPIGERLEQIPRLASARREAARGGSSLNQAMAFRDATVDFQRGGDWAKAINGVVPFFNTSVQGGAQVVRTARQNPAAFLAATAATIGLGTAASEAWNRADPQRAQDYADVPDYLKKTGLVFMLPGVEGTDQRDDRRPNFLWIPVGSYGSLVGAARDAIQKTAQGAGGPDLATLGGWGSLAADVGGIFSPLRGDSPAGAITSVIPPGLSTAAELKSNTDFYRGSTIATDRADQAASALAQGSAALFNRATGQETRPSQWEYLYRDLGGYGADVATAGSNLAAEGLGLRAPTQENRPIQNAPVVGSMVGRMVRDNVGQGLQTAQDERNRVPEGIRDVLQEVGLRREQVTPVSSTLQKIPLTREEQARWQERTNAYIEREVSAAARSPEYRKRGADQQKIIQDAITRAKQRAEDEVLQRIPPSQRDRRIREAQKAS